MFQKRNNGGRIGWLEKARKIKLTISKKCTFLHPLVWLMMGDPKGEMLPGEAGREKSLVKELSMTGRRLHQTLESW